VPRVERIRMIGAATLDLAFVAEGALDACVMMSNKPWDTAAGTLIAREAGAQLYDAQGDPHHLPVRFNRCRCAGHRRATQRCDREHRDPHVRRRIALVPGA
jgi:fructose-1,6-bisphosphatase/inositol monophosphatase family enzyme